MNSTARRPAAAPLATIPLAVLLFATAAVPIAVLSAGPALAQAKDNAVPADAEPKQVPLTQKQIDGVIAAQKEIRAIESKVPDKDADKDDPKTDAAVAAAVKKNGFASVEDFANTSFSVGMVLAGVDPQTKQYVGADAVTKKQMSDIQADTTMSAKDKKDALDELGAASKQTPTVKPIEGNIALVSKNYDALNAALQTDTE